uniref:MULE transposase domain-containing protein n=1 Tax=Plectus sambesii TaxID=2011161 RepID=A0A914WME3_9BILA
MVLIEEIYDLTTDAQRRPPLPFFLRLLSVVPLFQRLVTDYVTDQEQARTFLLDYNQPILNMIDTYLTNYKGLSSRLEGHPLRAMRTLRKMIKSQRFAYKIHDFHICRTTSRAFGTYASSPSGRPSRQRQPTVTLSNFSLTDSFLLLGWVQNVETKMSRDKMSRFVANYTNKGKPAAIYEGFAYIKDINLSEGKERYKFIHWSCNGYIWEFGLVVRVESLSVIDMTLERTKIAIHGPAGDLQVNFVLHDSGIDDENRMLMFGTTNSIISLGRSPTVHADGTFKITPDPFKQVYVLHYEENGRLYPGVFVLLPGKAKALYERMLNILKTLCPYEMTKIVTDFEFQAMTSFKDVFGVNVEGCFFHYAQAIMRNARNRDVFRKIAKSPLKKQHYVMLRALAFLPPGDIPSGFDALVHVIRLHDPQNVFHDLLIYMEETWVAPLCHPGRPALGKFPPQLWSVHTQTLTDQERTNNKVEGWHNRINNFMEHSHLAFYVFLDELKKFFRAEVDRRRKDQRSALERQARLANGEAVPVARDTYSLRSAALKVLCQQYQNQLYATNPQSTGLIRFLSEIADEMEDCVEFVENSTNKGKAAAIFEGYAYIKDINSSDGKERYRGRIQ